MVKYFLAGFFLLAATQSYAIFCPTNFSSIDFGDTIDQVKQVCGNPTSQHTYKTTTAASAEWIYYVRTRPMDPSTTKMSIAFKDNKVVNITITDHTVSAKLCQSATEVSNNADVIRAVCNNPTTPAEQSLGSTAVCGATIKIGDEAATVENACGNPVATTQYQPLNVADNTTPEMTVLQYDGAQPVSLVFENGRLKERNF